MLDELIAYCTSNNRICPKPNEWNKLWEMLPNRRRKGAGWEPPLPLILAAWQEPGMLKIARLQEHLRWASQFGALEEVNNFLRALPEDHWFHGTDG